MNPYHEPGGKPEGGQFARAQGNSSSDMKKLYLKKATTWKELKHFSDSQGIKRDRQEEYIDVFFNGHILQKLVFQMVKQNTVIKDVWEPADPESKLDKQGVDFVAEMPSGAFLTIDTKVATSHFGGKANLDNPSFSIVLFRYDPNKHKEDDGYFYKDNSTNLYSFTEIDTSYTKEELFNMGDKIGDTKNINGFVSYLIPKKYFQRYIEENFGDKQENYNRFQQLKYECLTFEKQAADMEIHGKDGTILKLVVNVDKQTGRYACTLRVDGNMLIKMKALSFEAKRQ